MHRYDIAIIGTGPAGISAAITAKIRKKDIVLFGSGKLSDKIVKANEILNYPGFPAISGEDFSKKLSEHLESMDISITEKKINAVYAMGDFFGIQAAADMYEARSVIIATGVVMGKPFAGEKEFLGRGVSYCATCDARLYKGKTVAVFGFNEESVAEADFLAEIAGKVYFFPISSKLNIDEINLNKKVEVKAELPHEIIGKMKVEKVKTDTSEYEVDGVFILRDAISPEQLVSGLAIENNHVKVNLMMETNIEGLFACGDIVGKPYQYIKAAGQGNVAALSAVAYL